MYKTSWIIKINYFTIIANSCCIFGNAFCNHTSRSDCYIVSNCYIFNNTNIWANIYIVSDYCCMVRV